MGKQTENSERRIITVRVAARKRERFGQAVKKANVGEGQFGRSANEILEQFIDDYIAKWLPDENDNG